MPYPNDNASYVDDGMHSEDMADNTNYETDVKDKVMKPARKSTKGRKLKRWDG